MSAKESNDDYESEMNRLGTFSTWPPGTGLSPTALVEAGFYYTGEGDKVMCFKCSMSHCQWKVGDNPCEVHKELSPDCEFINGMVQAHTDTEDTPGIEILASRLKSMEAQLKVMGIFLQSSELRSENATEICPTEELKIMARKAANPFYSDIKHRYESFATWSNSTGQDPKVLAEAGFYFTGSEDVVRCFMCNGGLRNWDVRDVPWYEHSRWFQGCTYASVCRSLPAVKSILEAVNHDKNAGERQSSNSENKAPHQDIISEFFASMKDSAGTESLEIGNLGHPVQVEDEIYSSYDTINDTESGDDEEEEDAEHGEQVAKCKICQEHLRSQFFLPCGHIICCDECAAIPPFPCQECDTLVTAILTGVIDWTSIELK